MLPLSALTVIIIPILGIILGTYFAIGSTQNKENQICAFAIFLFALLGCANMYFTVQEREAAAAITNQSNEFPVDSQVVIKLNKLPAVVVSSYNHWRKVRYNVNGKIETIELKTNELEPLLTTKIEKE